MPAVVAVLSVLAQAQAALPFGLQAQLRRRRGVGQSTGPAGAGIYRLWVTGHVGRDLLQSSADAGIYQLQGAGRGERDVLWSSVLLRHSRRDRKAGSYFCEANS